MPGAAYRSIANPPQYEKLRAKGFSKESAARMTNASASKRKVSKMTVSAFGVEDPAIAKAESSERTKMLAIGSGAAAGYAGAAHGASAMSRHQARQHWNKARTGPGKGNFTIPKARAAQSHLRLMNSSLKTARTARHARTGLALTAVGLGAGAYASHRRDRLGKSAFGIEH